MDTLVRLKLPWQSTQVLPTMTLCAVLLGGTRLNTSPVLRSLILDLPAKRFPRAQQRIVTLCTSGALQLDQQLGRRCRHMSGISGRQIVFC